MINFILHVKLMGVLLKIMDIIARGKGAGTQTVEAGAEGCAWWILMLTRWLRRTGLLEQLLARTAVVNSFDV